LVREALLPRRASAELPGFSPFEFKNPGVFLLNFNSLRAREFGKMSKKQQCEKIRCFLREVITFFAQHPAETL